MALLQQNLLLTCFPLSSVAFVASIQFPTLDPIAGRMNIYIFFSVVFLCSIPVLEHTFHRLCCSGSKLQRACNTLTILNGKIFINESYTFLYYPVGQDFNYIRLVSRFHKSLVVGPTLYLLISKAVKEALSASPTPLMWYIMLVE